MNKMKLYECISGGKLFELLESTTIYIAIIAIALCIWLLKVTIRDITNKKPTKRLSFVLVAFAITLILSGTLQEATIPTIKDEQCGNHAGVLIEILVKTIDILLLGLVLSIASTIINDKVSRGQLPQRVCHQVLNKSDIIKTITITVLATNALIWAMVFIFLI